MSESLAILAQAATYVAVGGEQGVVTIESLSPKHIVPSEKRIRVSQDDEVWEGSLEQWWQAVKLAADSLP